MVHRANPIAVICSNIFATCAVCGCLIGQQAVRQVILGFPPSSYVFSLDSKGFIATRLTGMNDSLWQYKTGPNRADQWSMRFQSPISEPPNATWIFRNIYFCRGESGMWRIGFRHSLLILLSVAAVVVTYRARLRALLSHHRRAGHQQIAHVAASSSTNDTPRAIRSGSLDCTPE